ncbi:hypothetical protein P7C70_g992, partial [Phenoliferia sp. Uapishka_3]
MQAVQRAEDSAARTRYAASAATLRRKADTGTARGHAHLQAQVTPSGADTWKSRADAQLAAGVVFPPRSIVEAAKWSFDHCHEGMTLLDHHFIRAPDGSCKGQDDSPIYQIALSILVDSQGMHLTSGNDPSYPLQEKMTDVIRYDTILHGYMKFLLPTALASDCINYFDQRRLSEGWEKSRKALTAMLSGLVFSGFIQCKQISIGAGLLSFRSAIDIIKAGREKWASSLSDLPNTCGPCFDLGFLRGVEVQLLVHLEQGYLRATTTIAKKAFPLEEIDLRAASLLKDLELNPIPIESSVQYTAFQAIASAVANKSRGMCLYLSSITPENKFKHGPLNFVHIDMSAKAGKYYEAAARALPEDAADRPNCFYRALALQLRGGGLTIRQAFNLGAEAEAAMVPPEKICQSYLPVLAPSLMLNTFPLQIVGSSNRNFEDRAFARDQLSTMRDWIEAGHGNVLAYTDEEGSPIPDPLDITLKPIPTAYVKELPESGNPMSLCDESFITSLRGHISLVEVLGPKRTLDSCAFKKRKGKVSRAYDLGCAKGARKRGRREQLAAYTPLGFARRSNGFILVLKESVSLSLPHTALYLQDSLVTQQCHKRQTLAPKFFVHDYLKALQTPSAQGSIADYFGPKSFFQLQGERSNGPVAIAAVLLSELVTSEDKMTSWDYVYIPGVADAFMVLITGEAKKDTKDKVWKNMPIKYSTMLHVSKGNVHKAELGYSIEVQVTRCFPENV